MSDSPHAQSPVQPHADEKKSWKQNPARPNSGSPAQAKHENVNKPRDVVSNSPRSQARGTTGQAPNQSVNANSNSNNNNSNKGKKAYKNQRGGAGKKGKPGGHSGQSVEVQNKIAELRKGTNAYFSDEEILNVLKDHNFDVERTFNALKEKRQNSWSARLVGKSPGPGGDPAGWQLPSQSSQAAPQPVAAPPANSNDTQPKGGAAKPQGQRKQKKGGQNSGGNSQDHHQQYQAVQKQEAPDQSLAKEINVDAKIARLEELVGKDLSIIETKAQYLKNLQEELRTVKAERDTQINNLNTEKQALLAKREELEKELIDIEHRVSSITEAVTQLQEEKDQKIKSLEEKYSRAIETDK